MIYILLSRAKRWKNVYFVCVRANIITVLIFQYSLFWTYSINFSVRFTFFLLLSFDVYLYNRAVDGCKTRRLIYALSGSNRGKHISPSTGSLNYRIVCIFCTMWCMRIREKKNTHRSVLWFILFH